MVVAVLLLLVVAGLTGFLIGELVGQRHVLRHCHPPEPAPVVAIELLAHRTGDLPAMQIRDNQQVGYSLLETDAAGNAVDGAPSISAPQWSLDRDDLVRLDLSDDGLTATAVALGGLGDTVVTVSVQLPDEDDGQGGTVAGKLLQGTDVVTVIGDDVAASIVLQPGTPTDQPVSPTA